MKANFLNKVRQNSFSIMLIGAFFALLVAYTGQYLFALMPCSLCILQRFPYMLLILCSAAALYFPKYKKSLGLFIVIISIAQVFLAAYHVGIEHYIFIESSVCKLIQNSHVASSCALVSFRFMNLSMAEWNLIYIMGLLYYFIKREINDGIFARRSK